MNELVKITQQVIGGETINAVNARELYEALGAKDLFANWVRNFIQYANLVENIDYFSFLENSKKPRGGRPAIEYAFTVDSAKQICMLTRTEIGKQIRLYFIECEKRLNNPAYREATRLLNAPLSEVAALLLDTAKAKEALEAQVKELEPKAQEFDRLADAQGTFCITDAAKTLQMRPKDLFDMMERMGWIYRRGGRGEWIANQDKIDQGLLVHKERTFQAGDGDIAKTQARVTAKGLAALALKAPKMPVASAVACTTRPARPKVKASNDLNFLFQQ